MSGKVNTIKRISRFSAALVFVFIIIYTNSNVSADDLLNRSISIGSSFTNQVTTHSYQFTTQTAANVGSVQFEYCSNSPLFSQPCIAPAGLNVSSAGVLSESGLTGFAVSGSTTNNVLIITRTPLAEIPTASSFTFDNITNPSTPDVSIYVKITVFDDEDGGGSVVDRGSVVFVTEDFFDVEAYVPPYLTFCVGVIVALNCSTTSGFLADFGEFSRFTASTATTQFAAATNDPDGYNVFSSGQTLTSGSNVIPNLTTTSASIPGTSQFGLNIRANTNPSVGSNIQSGPLAGGSVAPNYNTVNQFRYVSGERVAGASTSTGFNRYTVSYLVNVSSEQKPGLYASTLTYTAIASF